MSTLQIGSGSTNIVGIQNLRTHDVGATSRVGNPCELKISKATDLDDSARHRGQPTERVEDLERSFA